MSLVFIVCCVFEEFSTVDSDPCFEVFTKICQNLKLSLSLFMAPIESLASPRIIRTLQIFLLGLCYH